MSSAMTENAAVSVGKAPSIDRPQISTWLPDHVVHPRHQESYRQCLVRFRNQWQVEEGQAKILELQVAKRGPGTIKTNLRAMARLGTKNPNGRVADCNDDHVLELNNTLQHPSPLPDGDAPWPQPGQGTWEEATLGSRIEQLDCLVGVFAPRFAHLDAAEEPKRRRGRRPRPGARLARAWLWSRQQEWVPLPPSKTQRRSETTEDDWHRVLQTVRTQPYRQALQKPMMTFSLEVIIEDANRVPALLRARNRDLKLDDGGLPRIEVPGESRYKPTQVLYLSETAIPAAHVWIKAHPWRDDPDAWLIISVRHAAQGILMDYSPEAFTSAMWRTGWHSGMRSGGGPRSIRHHRHDEMATAGKSRDEIDRFFKRSRGSKAANAYAQFNRERGARLMRRVRGLPVADVERRCPGCRSILPPGLANCTMLRCPRMSTDVGDVTNADLLADLGLTVAEGLRRSTAHGAA
jgi:hypothetical protein